MLTRPRRPRLSLWWHFAIATIGVSGWVLLWALVLIGPWS
jgi:hypothetical protein